MRIHAMSERVVANLAKFSPCDPLVSGDEVCAKRFIETFGKRAWRRPIAGDELASLFALFQKGRTGGTFASGIAWITQALLQSAPFLYRVEYGVKVATNDSAIRLTPWETATRLSYLLWGSMPDAPLFAAAEAGQLESPEQIKSQARRMIATASTKAQVGEFHAQWLLLDEVEHAEKDRAAFPTYTDEIPGRFKSETNRFLDHVLWQGTGAWQQMLTAPFTFADPVLAKFYGLPQPGTNSFESVSLEDSGRIGILTQGSIMAAHAKANQTSPILRGKFIRERLFCQQLPAPPPNADTKAPELDPNLTTRERFALHSTHPACAACHQLMDPIGLGFENFDAISGWRTSENGKPINASGELSDTDVDGKFDGVAQLSKKLATSEQVQQCLALQWFRFSFGRLESESDGCSLATIFKNLNADASLEDLLLAVVGSDAFMYRAKGGVQ
jgi:Protein of unknown function (DUF1592)/Protein of unknown function (DUF1588)/Protein of unknown function (DUF1595)/Protein of unknown function (DUF1585)